MLLDLTAAFDTVDHQILLSRLELCVGITGNVLKWFKSYQSKRTFSVHLGQYSSAAAPLVYGVPQGSILSPILFALYLLPLGSIFKTTQHFVISSTNIPAVKFKQRINKCIVKLSERCENLVGT